MQSHYNFRGNHYHYRLSSCYDYTAAPPPPPLLLIALNISCDIS